MMMMIMMMMMMEKDTSFFFERERLLFVFRVLGMWSLSLSFFLPGKKISIYRRDDDDDLSLSLFLPSQ